MRTVRVQVALIGPAEDRRRARELFEERRWEVADAREEDYPADPVPDGVIPGEAVLNSVYTLRIPVPRDAGGRPQLWASQEVQNLADDAGLDLRPMSAQMRERERRQEPHWFVYEPSSMPSRRWVRWLWDWERRTGRQDTGDVLFGSYEDVRRRAGQNQVRPPFLRRVSTHERLPRIGVAQGRRAVLKAAGLSWAAGLLGVPVGSGPWWLVLAAGMAWVLLTWWCARTMLPLVRRPATSPAVRDGRTSAGDGGDTPPDFGAVHRRQMRHTWVVALTLNGVLLAGILFLARISSPAAALGINLFLIAALFVMDGIRRLAGASTWRPFLVASFVALLPVFVPALCGIGPVLFTFYGASFHVRAEELDVADAWQFVASAYVLAIPVALTLVFLAVWGYVLPLIRERALRPLLPIVVLGGIMALALTWIWAVVGSAETSGRAAVDQWRQGWVPEPYFNVNPQPVCVSTIDPLADLPLYGHRLDPERVYGAFGVVSGQVTLWDPVSGNTFSLPADAVQVLPAGKSEPGSAIPRACSS